MKKRLSHLYWIPIVVFIVILDQITKIIVRNSILPISEITVIPNFFSLTFVKNEGIAFGAFSKFGSLSKVIIIIFTVLLILFTTVLLITEKIKHPFGVISIAMIIGGGIGNLIDRVLIRYVTDFFAFTFFGREFAVFNVADIFVTVGTLLFMGYFLFFDRLENHNSVAGESENGIS